MSTQMRSLVDRHHMMILKKSRAEANSKRSRDKTWDWFCDDFMARETDDEGLLNVTPSKQDASE
jgi:hypothetical protein